MKPKLGVCYYPEHWPANQWHNDAKRMKECGLSWVRIGEFSWSRLEPQPEQYQWQWLDDAIAILAAAGLDVILGTPSATPPRWMLDKYPDMLAIDASGNPREFGSRRHYCFSHAGYRQEATQMAERMAQRYGDLVQAWQIDNEYGCHETTRSYSSHALTGFQLWLKKKYHSIELLNNAWGNVFWSMEYHKFDQIKLPNLTVTEPNPAQVVDFFRYSSDQVIAFNKAQATVIQAHSTAPLIHNYMGWTTDFDHFALAQDVDIASWDSYPLGFLERFGDAEISKENFYRQGDPDFQAFHHDLYRAVGAGRWWVMEQQPGPVNWAPWNPAPLDGMVRLWTWEAIAHGAEVISYFRWRQLPCAQEQMHAGLLRPDGVEAQGWKEVRQVAEEISQWTEQTTTNADVALVFDYQSVWAWEAQPQGQDFHYFHLLFSWYRCLRRLGLSVDILPANSTDFTNRKLVLIPGLMHWNIQLHKAIETSDAVILAGPRTGSKTVDMSIPLPLPPTMPGVDCCISRVSSLPPQICIPLAQGGNVIHWQEHLETSQAIETTEQGEVVLAGANGRYYLGSWLDRLALTRLFSTLCEEANITTYDMPEGVRQRQRGQQRFILNYNAHPIDWHGQTIAAADCACLQ